MARTSFSELIERFQHELPAIQDRDPRLRLKTIADELSVSINTARELKNKLGLRNNPRGRVGLTLSDSQLTDILQLIKSGVSERDIAKQTGINRNRVQDAKKQLRLKK